MVWLKPYRRPKGKAAKLQPKLVGPHLIEVVPSHHTYGLQRNGQNIVQHDTRIELRVSKTDSPFPVLPRNGPVDHILSKSTAKMAINNNVPAIEETQKGLVVNNAPTGYSP